MSRIKVRYWFPLIALAMMSIFVTAPAAHATDITVIFHDLTETPGIEILNNPGTAYINPSGCGIDAGGCGVGFFGAAVASVTGPHGEAVNFTVDDTHPFATSFFELVDAQGVSDWASIGDDSEGGGYEPIVYFTSDGESPLPHLNHADPRFLGEITETGLPQLLFTANLQNGDTIRWFAESDIESAPEPSSVLLLTSGLLGLA